jgi:hypothetical protein
MTWKWRKTHHTHTNWQRQSTYVNHRIQNHRKRRRIAITISWSSIHTNHPPHETPSDTLHIEQICSTSQNNNLLQIATTDYSNAPEHPTTNTIPKHPSYQDALRQRTQFVQENGTIRPKHLSLPIIHPLGNKGNFDYTNVIVIREHDPNIPHEIHWKLVQTPSW